MKRKGQGRGDPKRMKKLKLSVQEFVEKAESSGVQDTRGEGIPGGRVKNRRELRKEKRKAKKIRRKQYYERRHLGTPGVQAEAMQSSEEHSEKKQEKNEGKKQEKKEQKKPSAPRVEPSKKKAIKEEARKKALIEANEKEEKEIKRLEKSLRMNKRKNKSSLPQSFAQDGLDYILGVLEPGGSASGLYEEDEEEDAAQRLHKLSEKVSKALEDEQSDTEDEEMSEGDGSVDQGLEEDEKDCDIHEESADESDAEAAMGEEVEDSAEDQVDSDGSESINKESSTNNTKDQDSGSKYIPPQLRQTNEVLDAKKREELERVKKNVKGLINRLSEPNLPSISGQLEELYMANSRNTMNDTLISVLLDACITPARMPDRLMMEHVLLVSVLHHSVGIEVGAHVLETVVKKFYELYEKDTDSKECDNLIIFIGHLYNFHVIESCLVFDILKKLVVTFTEKDIELVLLLLKNIGFSLRKDDPLALKELICDAQSKANDAGKKFQDQTRVRFMLDTMLALKNNDMRKIPGYDPEPVEKLRKLLRSLVHNSASGSDTRLRVSLENLLDADQVGRWWIVGSSWSGAPMIDSSTTNPQPQSVGKVSAKIMELARKQRMNTDIRRNIFCVLMTSEDFLDAFEKLLKLGLKDHQEREIVHVLLDCCLQEKLYNPFYAVLSSKFCEYDRRFQMTFQFSMWDKFRDLGNLSTTVFSNLINLLSHMLKRKSLPLSIFKVIEFSELDKTKVSFLRQVLYKLLMETDVEDLLPVFVKVSENPKLGMLREGLKLFITHFLVKNIRAQKSTEEAELLSQRADLAVKALQAKENRLQL
ncbi:nucleolar MIF4G domain-containing protein 1 [Bombina bombina]|uniref:nucleolar MIF4G domain-containing protein 1 n=1 Tax=Bombina bombina TaxID=8345 RepID=UPI00235AA01C|nr:nucleolar MIF4G domain-containing protein 1 [Bombina bombina]